MVAVVASSESAIELFLLLLPVYYIFWIHVFPCHIVHVCHYIQVIQPKQCLPRLRQKTFLSLLLSRLKK